MSNKKGVVSLFSGCGGMDLGFEGGFDVLKAAVKNPQSDENIASGKGSFVKLK